MNEQPNANHGSEAPPSKAGFLHGRLFLFVVWFNLALFLGYALKGAYINYPFWIDELYSVTASRLLILEMLRLTVSDVHPPLYYLSLKAWIQLAGPSELGARSLSFLFASLAIVFFWRLRAALPARAFQISLALFTSSYFLFFYAQEVRSYALLLLLSTAGYSFYLRDEPRRLIAVSTLMGLTHFFGTLLGGFFLASILLQRQMVGLRFWAIVGLAIIALWPTAQIYFSMIDDYAGGGFWIETTPLGAIQQALFTSLPILEGVMIYADAIFGTAAGTITTGVWLILAGTIMLFAVITYRSHAVGTDLRRSLSRCLLIYAVVIGAAVIISFHTPVATKRNYIVLVPIVSIILGITFHTLLLEKRFLATFAAFTLFLLEVSSVLAIVYKLENKHRPWEDWRSPANAAFEFAQDSKGSVYYFENEFGSAEWLGHVYRYYAPEPDRLSPLTLPEITSPRPGDVLLFGHEVCTGYGPLSNRIIDRLRDAEVAHRVVWSEQYLDCPNGLVIYE